MLAACDKKPAKEAAQTDDGGGKTEAVVAEAQSAAVSTIEVAPLDAGKKTGGATQYPEMAELEKEVKMWKDDKVEWQLDGYGSTYKKSGQFFDFSGSSAEGEGQMSATNKKQIGDCPAGSVWSVSSDQEGWGKFEIPTKCKSITPKSIIEFK